MSHKESVLDEAKNSLGETKPNLVHEARVALLARWAKYSDPTNLFWNWEDAQKYEHHAINAVLDLEAVEARAFPSESDKKLLAALKELLTFGVEMDDARLTYIVAQVDRNAVAEAKALIAEIERIK